MDSFTIPGGIKSPEDPRDFKPSDIIGAGAPTPAVEMTDISMVPVYMQDQQPACGGHAGVTLGQALMGLGTTLSPRFVYALCKKVDGIPNEQGTTARAIMQVLQKYGVCTDELFPNDTSLPYAQYADWTLIPAAAYVDALSRRIGPYAQLQATDFQTIKDAVNQHKVVLILGKDGPEWWNPSWNAADILPLRPPTAPITGHFWVDFGFDPITTYFRNSWSKAWGNSGNGAYGENYTPYIIEAWVAQLPAPVTPTPAQLQNLQQQVSLTAKIVQLLTNWIKGRTTTN